MRHGCLSWCLALALGGCARSAPATPAPPVQTLPVAPVVTGPSQQPAATPNLSIDQAAAAYAAHQSFLGSGMSGPNGLALDGGGDLYESDYYRGTVTRVTPAGGVSQYAAGFSGPAGLAFDPQGRLLVACFESHRLERIPAGGGRAEPFVAAGLRQPVWPVVDGQGRIYLADYGGGRIARIGPAGEVSTFVALPGVNALACDDRDHLWVTTWGGQVAEVTPDAQVRPISSGLASACAIAWHPSYLAVGTYGEEHQTNGRLLLVGFDGQTREVATGLSRTSSAIFDRQGNLVAANIGDTALRKYALR